MFLLNSFETGGTEMNAVRTAEGLDPARVRLSVAAFRPYGPLLPRYERLGIGVHPVRIPNLYGSAAMLEMVRFARYLRRERIEVLHTHDVYCNIFGAPAGRLAGLPGVLASRRWWKRVPKRGLLVPNRLAYALADKVLVNAAAVGHMLKSDERVSPSKIFLLHNFLEEEAFIDVGATERSEWRARLGLPAGALLAGSVGRLAAVKDNATLIRAIARIEASIGLHAVFVGDGPEHAMLESLAAALHVRERVHFLGEQPNRPNLHQLFDISVSCSLSEGFPNSLLEAMAAGKAVVATPVGGVPDALRHGANGLLFAPGNDVALAADLERLASDRPRRDRLGGAARATARHGYARKIVLEQLVSLYEELAGRRVA